MGWLLVQVLPLGIGAAFTPSLVALQILIVGQDPWHRRALAVILGAGSAFGIAGALFLFGFAKLPVPESGHDVIGGLVRLAAAVILAIACTWLFRPHPVLQKKVEQGITTRVGKASVMAFFVMAFLLSIKDLSSFVLLIPAIHDIAVAQVNIVEKVVVLVVLYTLALSGVLLPPVARIVLGRRSNDSMARIYRFTMDHQFQIAGVVAAVFVVYLTVTGFSQLR